MRLEEHTYKRVLVNLLATNSLRDILVECSVDLILLGSKRMGVGWNIILKKMHRFVCVVIYLGLISQSEQAKIEHWTRLNASIDCIRFLMRQGIAFRGHDELKIQENCFTGSMEKQTELRSMKNAEKKNLEKSNLEISSPTVHTKLHTGGLSYEYEALFKHDNKVEVR
ncbi:zinc finger MYM-type protein 1-like protein [Cinnamomum micranthum f. kanehirae]|uniref:Zinc finger MYM-type protein 1-like protein n=1 Tax=Cinnamomum micranthum f. kanehirae TaxID=337451 RepID=A0A443N3Z2_9MAGN|nr:zinc finger MYM-type protein 1-like protein [Cinnamomum micranthum f. kanehirae]